MNTLAEHLRDLPILAARTITNTAVHVDLPGRHPDELHHRQPPGSKPPPGVNLARITNQRPAPDLLPKLGECIQTVMRQAPPNVFRTFPPATIEGTETWLGETTWLIATMPWWQTNPWCNEWITTTTHTLRTTLINRIERANNWTSCAICLAKITNYATATLEIAECQPCGRIIAMQQRTALTVKDAAAALGITVDAVQKRIQRGQLRKVGRRGKQALIAPAGRLDWALDKDKSA